MFDNAMMLYAVVVVALAAMLMYSNFQSIRKGKEMHKQQKADQYEVLDVSKSWMILYVIMIVLILILLALGKQSWEVVMISIALLGILAMEVAGAFLRFKLYYNDKNFMFDTGLYRIKSIRTIQKQKKWININKKSEVVMFDGKRIIVPQAIGDRLEEILKNKK